MANVGVPGLQGSGHWVAVVPSNTVDLATMTRGLYVGVTGDVIADSESGDTSVTFTALAAGVIHPLRVKRVRATGTTATGIVAIYAFLFVVMAWGMHGFVV